MLVYVPRAGADGSIPNLNELGLALGDAAPGEGPIVEYMIGPAWTGAKYQTIGAAVAQAVADGHSTSVNGAVAMFFIYPGLYTEDVVIPNTVPRWALVGEGGTRGSEINGTFTATLPQTGANFSARNIRFIGAVSITQPGPDTGTSVAGRFYFCTFTSTVTTSTPNVQLESWDCSYSNAMTLLVRTNVMSGCRWLHGTAPVVIEVSVASGGNSIMGCYCFSGTFTFRGRAVGFNGNLMYYNGSLGIIDECVSFSEYCNNTFSSNAGPAGSPIQHSGASSVTDGGNSFVDGGTYPYIQMLGGTRPNRGRNDDELRAVISVAVPAGPVVLLTAAQVANLDLLVQVTAGGGVLQLPACTTVPIGARVTVKKLSAVASFVVQGTGINFVDSAASIAIVNPLGCLTFQNDGVSNWNIVGSYLEP